MQFFWRNYPARPTACALGYQATAACLSERCRKQKTTASTSNTSAKLAHCRLSGSLTLLSQDRTKAVAIPIFNATWPGVRFFCSQRHLIQLPTVFLLSANGLDCGSIFDFLAYFTRIERCAIPNRATHRWERENVMGTS